MSSYFGTFEDLSDPEARQDAEADAREGRPSCVICLSEIKRPPSYNHGRRPEFCSLECKNEGRKRAANARVTAPFMHEGALVCLVELTGEASTLIDASDAERVGSCCWQLSRSGGYAVGHLPTGMTRLHRFLMDAPPDMEVDHINRNRLDNRRANLRVIPQAGNRQNCSCRSPTGERGVSFHREVRADGTTRIRYQVRVTAGGVKILNTTASTLAAAIAMAREARRKHMPYSAEALEAQSV